MPLKRCEATRPEDCVGDNRMWNTVCQKATASPENPCQATVGDWIPPEKPETRAAYAGFQLIVEPETYSLTPIENLPPRNVREI